ncbi:ABC-three component system protein [Candidatus Poriferisodalis sp.]|uniref:ABC-three component system protein n=1 Tax=Candidatus Poriferisodalis sp. TaxID=3101277 RepID=UPI003B024F6E
MIRSVVSSDERFKHLKFEAGLNVIRAERTLEATEHQTRNGSGKSSLIRLLHFILGGNAPGTSVFRRESLRSSMFSAELEVDNDTVWVSRTGARPNKLYVSPSEPDIAHSEGLDRDDYKSVLGSDCEELSLEQWKQRLSRSWFRIDCDAPTYSPTMRSLLSYLIRREHDDGFQRAFDHSRMQQPWDRQVCISYFLDLDWSISREIQLVRKQEQELKALQRAASSAEFGSVLGRSADLRSELIVARDRVQRMHAAVTQYQVLDEYASLVAEADQLTTRLRDIRGEDTIDRDLIRQMEELLLEEQPPDVEQLGRLWKQVKVVLPKLVYETYESVYEFHNSVLRNRRLYLQRETELARERIATRQVETADLENRRSELMRILDSGGALEEYAALQAEVSNAQAQVKQLQERYELAQNIEGGKARLANRRAELAVRLNGDYNDRRERLDRAITRFEAFSSELYEERHGYLVVDATSNGPTFEVKIAGKESAGIHNMQILCFDFVVATLLREREVGPGFLVHDSHIFDGVDERQIAASLHLGARLAEEYEFQYIVTLNSDMIPDFPSGFDFGSYVNDVSLTDAIDTGGLFGFRFD